MSHQEERPIFDKGSHLWHQSTQDVEAYIDLLERRLIEYDEENQELKAKIQAVEHNRELTIRWAKGEIEN